MSIFGSNNQQSGTMGGLISGLFRTFSGGNPPAGDAGTSSRNTGGINRKLAGGALLAAGAAYLYNRSKNKKAGLSNLGSNI
ncbi:hypothetical protein [Hymenobacter sp. GOD-10R]|uniref:hypothetical protein n=1 Tax=Hymenobacter sp. GOD-10R TaxID=3093922 RepID=UPI002D7A031A|nr:hypothetical protein [Hymenobacter sp. GOD-10R]WRQ30952.1 hypothetical protein SD425_11845 [Hymenobacter sp. GOD-10R]